MKTLRNIAVITGIFVLSGCSAFSSFSEVEALNEAQPLGSPFTQALASEYRDFANRELNEMFDYPDSLHFARKGLAAASGENVLPEPVGDWNLKEDHIRELSAARGRLMVVLDLGARESSPANAAKTQANFDCWIEQQEEEWKIEEIQACKSKFFDLLQGIESNLSPAEPQQVKTLAEAQDLGVYDIDPLEPMEPENAMYLVFFNWNSYGLDDSSLNVLSAVAGEVSTNPPETVTVVGHTDTTGPKSYNQKLALKRANAVKSALIKEGVDGSLMSVNAKGEEELLVPTPDNVREPANRRVNISFQ